MSVVEFQRPMDRRAIRQRLFNPVNAVPDPEEKTVATILAETRAERKQLQMDNERLRAELKATLERLATAHLNLQEATKFSESAGRPSFKFIVAMVSSHTGVSVADIMSDRRLAIIVYARQLAFYVCKQHTTLTLPAIGLRFGRDHTTVLHGIRKIESALATDETCQRDVKAINERLAV